MIVAQVTIANQQEGNALPEIEVLYGEVWCGILWYGAVWCIMVHCGAVWYSALYATVWCGVVGYGVAECGIVW